MIQKKPTKMTRLFELFSHFFRIFCYNNPWIYLILLLSFLLIFWGFNWGLNYHPDEVYDRVFRFSTFEDLNPTTVFESHPDYSWTYPTFHIYVLTLIYRIYYQLSQIIHFTVFYSLFNPILSSWDNLIRLTRLITMIQAVFAVYLIFRVGYLGGNKTNRRNLSLIGALILATSNIWVNNAHFATLDIPLAFWLVFAIYLLQRSRVDSKYLLIAAFVGGLAFSTKWTGGLFLVVLLFECARYFALADQQMSKKVLITVGSVLAFIFGFFVGTPFFFLDFPNAYEGLIFELEKSQSINRSPFQAISEILTIFTKGIGYFSTVIGFISLLIWSILRLFGIILKWKKESDTFISDLDLENLDIIGLITWVLFIFQLRKPFVRDTIPLILFFSIFIAFGTLNIIYFLIKISNGIQPKRFRRLLPYTGIALLVIGVFLIPLISSAYNSFSIQNDTRRQAEIWFNDNVKHNSTIAICYLPSRYVPQLDTNYYNIIEYKPNLSWLFNSSFDYLVLTSFYYNRHFNTELWYEFWGPLLYDRIEGFYRVIVFEKFITGYYNLLPPMEFVSPKISIITRT